MVAKRKNNMEDGAGPSKKAKNPVKKISQNSEIKRKMKKLDKHKKNEEVEIKEPDSDVELDNDTETSDHEVMDNLVENTTAKTTNDVHVQVLTTDIPNWPVAHMSELLRRLEGILPPRDHLVYKSRVDRIKWEEVAFQDYTGEQCRLMWEAMQKRLRRFRILQELIEDAKDWISKPWTNFYRGNKTNRHPDMPRRPLSTYMIFYMKKKDNVLKENPGLEMTGLSKHIAEMYKKLPPKTKEKYNEMAAIQRKEYETKLKEFYRLHPELTPTSAKSSSVSQVPNDPLLKKPATPFKMFCEDKFKKHQDEPDFDKITFLEHCKEQWKEMSDKKKVFWINWALERETKYQEDIKKYVAENPDFVPNVTKSILTKEERTLRERMAGKPEKPPNSAYSLFSRLMLASEEVKAVSPKERMLLIAQQWKNCPETEKKEYADRVKHMLEQYKLQYAEYLESLPEDKRQEELLNNQPKKKKLAKAKLVTTPTLKTKPANKNTAKKVSPKKNIKNSSKNKSHLYEGEPEQPPATPYLLYLKKFEENGGSANEAHEAWAKMDEEQRSVYRKILWELKKIYIDSYEKFLKGLTQDELKQYSEWKKNSKTNQDFDESSESSEEEVSDEEASNDDDE